MNPKNNINLNSGFLGKASSLSKGDDRLLAVAISKKSKVYFPKFHIS